MSAEGTPIEIVYLNHVVGWNGRRNEVILARRPSTTEAPASLVVFFAGDMQDVSSAMIQRPQCRAYARWCLENVLVLLANKFPASLVMAVKASEMGNDTFALYNNFVPCDKAYGIPSFCDDYGAWLHVDQLMTSVLTMLCPFWSAPACVRFIGFSKGCVVLNQLIWEVSAAAQKQLAILNKINAIYWLDGGHAGRSYTWLCDDTRLRKFAENMPFVKLQIDVTPYQMKDARRPWICEQEARFVFMLRKYGVQVTVFEHFFNEPPSLENHFQVIENFKPTL